MAKVTHLGLASKDDPIYKSGPQVFVPMARPSSPEVRQKMCGVAMLGQLASSAGPEALNRLHKDVFTAKLPIETTNAPSSSTQNSSDKS